MIREWLVRAANLTLPRPERDELGPEIEGTVLEGREQPRRAFARELLDLVRYGLDIRARRAATGVSRVIADGLCRGATWIMILDLVTLAVWRLDGTQPALATWWSMGLLAVALATAILGADRIAGIGALSWLLTRAPHLAAATAAVEWVPPAVFQAAVFSALILMPRSRGRDLRRLGWLTVPALLFLVIGADTRGGMLLVLLAVVVVVVAAAAISLPTDPRLAIAASLPVTYVGLGVADRGGLFVAVLLVCAPAVLCLSIFRERQLQLRPM